MKYEAHLVGELKKPSIIPLKASTDRKAAIAEFERLRRAHGDESVLKFKFMEIHDDGTKKEIVLTGVPLRDYTLGPTF